MLAPLERAFCTPDKSPFLTHSIRLSFYKNKNTICVKYIMNDLTSKTK